MLQKGSGVLKDNFLLISPLAPMVLTFIIFIVLISRFLFLCGWILPTQNTDPNDPLVLQSSDYSHKTTQPAPPKYITPACLQWQTRSLIRTLTNSSSRPTQTIFSKYALAANATVPSGRISPRLLNTLPRRVQQRPGAVIQS